MNDYRLSVEFRVPANRRDLNAERMRIQRITKRKNQLGGGFNFLTGRGDVVFEFKQKRALKRAVSRLQESGKKYKYVTMLYGDDAYYVKNLTNKRVAGFPSITI